MLPQRHPAFFVAFAENFQALFVGEKAGEFELDQFGYTESAAVHHLDNDMVAHALHRTAVEGVLESGDFVVGEHIGQMVGARGHIEQFGGIGRDSVFDNEHFEEGAPAAYHATLGGGAHLGRGDEFEEFAQMVGANGDRFELERGHEACHVVEVLQVGCGGIVGVAAFQPEVGLERASVALPCAKRLAVGGCGRASLRKGCGI